MKALTQVTIAMMIGSIGLASARADDDHHHNSRDFSHVLLISVDGMHASDLTNYISHHPNSSSSVFPRTATSILRPSPPRHRIHFRGLLPR